MVVQMLVFEGDWSVCEDTLPTPDHTPANGGRTLTQSPRYENGISGRYQPEGILKKIWGKFLGKSSGQGSKFIRRRSLQAIENVEAMEASPRRLSLHHRKGFPCVSRPSGTGQGRC